MSPLRRRLLVALLIGAATALLIAKLLPALPSSTLTVRVDLSSSAGSTVNLYLNDQLERPPQIQQLTPNVRNTYEFEAPHGSINRIRVDVAGSAGAVVRFYGIEVVDAEGKRIAYFGPPDILTWARYSTSEPVLEAEAVRFTGRAPGASIDAFRKVPAPSRLVSPIRQIVETLNDPEGRLRFGLIVLALGCCLLALGSSRGRWTISTAAATALGSVLALHLVLQNPSGLTSASEALGRATYLGLSMPTNIRGVQAIYACSVLLVLVAALAWWWRHRDLRSENVKLAPTPSTARPGFPSFAVAGCVLIAALGVFVPDLRVVLQEGTSGLYPTGWDVENLLVWSELSSRGLVPMADYWYPYGNFSVFESSLVRGEILYAVYQLGLFLTFWWVFLIASRQRLFAASLAALGLLALQPVIGEFPRYGLSAAIALSYSCIDSSSAIRSRRAARIVFALVTTVGLFLDPILVAYAAVGVLAVLAVDVVANRRLGVRWWLTRLAGDFAAPVVGLVLLAAVAVARGQLDGMADFYATLDEIAVYSALPTALMPALDTAIDLGVLVVWAPAAILAAGLFARISERPTRVGYGLGARLLILGAVAAPFVLKHSVRPIPTQLLLFPLLALLLVLLWASARPSHWYAVGAFGGLLAAVALGYPGPERISDGVRELPGRTARDLDVLLLDRGSIRRARAGRFSDERFASYTQELAVARDLRNRPDFGDPTDVYVLGDAPVLYSLLRQQPPWQLTLYNTSPIEEQRRIVKWLEEEAPRFVVVDRTGDSFDNVPQDVRVPVVFAHVVRNYQPDHSVGPYDVLVRRRAAPNDSYWAQVLGHDVDLSQVPEVSSYDEPGSCRRRCAMFLVVRAPKKGWRGRVEVPVRFRNERIVVRFDARGDAKYTIPLARTWAWGLSRSPKLAGSPTKGWRASIVKGEQPEHSLY